MIRRVWVVFSVSDIREMEVAMVRNEEREIKVYLTSSIGEVKRLLQKSVESANANHESWPYKTIEGGIRVDSMTLLKTRKDLGSFRVCNPSFWYKRR